MIKIHGKKLGDGWNSILINANKNRKIIIYGSKSENRNLISNGKQAMLFAITTILHQILHQMFSTSLVLVIYLRGSMKMQNINYLN